MIQNTGGKKLGQILVEAGLITESQLSEALERQKKDGGRVCSHLVKLGYLKVDVLLEFLRLQFGVAAVNLSNYRIPPQILSLIPRALARQHHVVPVNLLDRNLTLAMEDPRDNAAIGIVEKYTGLQVDPLICPQAVIEDALQRYYPETGESAYQGMERRVFTLDEKEDPPSIYDYGKKPRELSAVNWLKRIVFLGIKKRSREIHLEPREDDVLVRYRVGAKLVNGETIPLASGMSIPGILYGHSWQDHREFGMKQGQGWVKVKVRHRELKLLFSICPVVCGDRVVMKLLDESYLKRPLTEQGLDKEEEARLKAALERRKGLFLIASPSEHQRIWTMYHLLELVKNDSFNIITVEPFLLFPVAGVNQTLYSKRRGYTQKDVLIGALRQEPDIIGLAQLSDYDILELVLNAAAQRLVVATLPMANTYEVISWLQGFHGYSLALAHLLAGIVTLRIVSRLCPSCRRALESQPDILEGTRDMRPEDMKFFESPGCDRCEGTGRVGHLGLFESLIPDGELRDLIATSIPAKVIYEEAQRRGMRTILEDGLIKASRGEVDVRDVLQVAPAGLEPGT